MYKFLLGTTKTFVELVKQPDLSFRLLLNCAQSASETGFQVKRMKKRKRIYFCLTCKTKAVAYQFIEKAYTIYEQDITDSVAQFNAMNLLIPTLATLRLAEEDSMTLLAKTAQHCSRVLKKTDQCALVSLVSHLFQDPARVMECMQVTGERTILWYFCLFFSHFCSACCSHCFWHGRGAGSRVCGDSLALSLLLCRRL